MLKLNHVPSTTFRFRALLLLAVAVAARDVTADTFTVPLSNPGKPARVEVSLISGSVSVVGAAIDTVIIDVLQAEGEDRDDDAPRGMHRIPQPARGLTFEEKDNVVEISFSPARGNVDVEIKVPAASSARLSSVNGNKVEVRDVNGELDLHNTNGKIRAVNVSGPVSASTVNGSVYIELSATPVREEMAFSTLNGDVEVTLPDGFGADLTLRSDNGRIYSDFELTSTASGTNGNSKGRDRVGQKVTGTINGGGPALLLRTFNGDILLHNLALKKQP